MWRRVLLDEPGLRVAEVRCGGDTGWSETEPATGYALVLARQGVFRRRVDGVESLVDPVTGYLQVPGTEQQIAHPAGGDVCTSIGFDPPDSAGAGPVPGRPHGPQPRGGPVLIEPGGPRPRGGPVLIGPGVDLAHRRLVAAASRGVDPVALADLAGALAAAVLTGATTTAGRVRDRRLADRAREALHHDPNVRLTAVAAELAVSPYHLSRVFHRVTGVTLAGYRGQLRARRAMDLLARADDSIARVAATLGYADQAHLTRAVRSQAGVTPRQLRRLLRRG